MISGPRNISTAMMYAFAQRQSCTVVDEPFYAHYLKRTGVDHPGREKTIASMSTDPNLVIKNVILGDYLTEEVYIKNMGHHLLDVDFDFLSGLTNMFLVRDPKRIIASFTKVIPDITIMDIGLKHQFEVWKYLVEELGQNPVVVDTGNVLKNPQSMIQKLCIALTIPFEQSMLTWEPGPRNEDGVWAEYWYGSLHESDGLKQKTEEEVELDSRYDGLLEEAQYYYDHLKKFEII